MAKQIKTNAMRILERKKMAFLSFQYTGKEENTDGTLVARKNDRDTTLVHKTLVTKSIENELFVFVVPIKKELDLKKAARAAGVKKIEMLPLKELQKNTGYVKGGCSPIGMKKEYPTFLELSSESKEKVIVSGGKIGYIIEVSISNLMQATNGILADICKDS